jgi:hypothetical protein
MRSAELAYSQEGTLVYVPYRPPQRTLVWVDRKGAQDPVRFPPGEMSTFISFVKATFQ